MNEFLKLYVKMYKNTLDFKHVKKMGAVPINLLCEKLSEEYDINDDDIVRITSDEKTNIYTCIIGLINGALIIKMCRTYYISVGIIIGIITSLLFGYFMG